MPPPSPPPTLDLELDSRDEDDGGAGAVRSSSPSSWYRGRRRGRRGSRRQGWEVAAGARKDVVTIGLMNAQPRRNVAVKGRWRMLMVKCVFCFRFEKKMLCGGCR